MIKAISVPMTDLMIGQRVVYCLSWGSHIEYAEIPAKRTGEFAFDEVLEARRSLRNRSIVGKPLLRVKQIVD